MSTDYHGRPVSENESPDTIIKVWEISPHPDSREYDCCVIRSWQHMLDYVSNHLDDVLDRLEPEDEKAGISIRFRVIEMTRGDYDELCGA